MATTSIERRINNLLHELMAVKKELLLEKLHSGRRVRKSTLNWVKLGKTVSSAWDNVSAVDEIKAQREKG